MSGLFVQNVRTKSCVCTSKRNPFHVWVRWIKINKLYLHKQEHTSFVRRMSCYVCCIYVLMFLCILYAPVAAFQTALQLLNTTAPQISKQPRPTAERDYCGIQRNIILDMRDAMCVYILQATFNSRIKPTLVPIGLLCMQWNNPFDPCFTHVHPANWCCPIGL